MHNCAGWFCSSNLGTPGPTRSKTTHAALLPKFISSLVALLLRGVASLKERSDTATISSVMLLMKLSCPSSGRDSSRS